MFNIQLHSREKRCHWAFPILKISSRWEMSWTNEDILLSVLSVDQLLTKHDKERNREKKFSFVLCMAILGHLMSRYNLIPVLNKDMAAKSEWPKGSNYYEAIWRTRDMWMEKHSLAVARYEGNSSTLESQFWVNTILLFIKVWMATVFLCSYKNEKYLSHSSCFVKGHC